MSLNSFLKSLKSLKSLKCKHTNLLPDNPSQYGLESKHSHLYSVFPLNVT